MVANGFDGVPWMVGGGAKHSANVGRVLAYAATSGGEGVISPGDLKVSQTTQANNQVHVATGALALRNFYGNARSETYIGRAAAVSDVTVGSTGSTPRSDLLVARIRDPQYGGQAPASLADGPYIFPEIIPGVPANTTSARQLGLSEPMYALARIDVPANTTNITDGMIKNLRELVLPRSQRFMFSNNAGAVAADLTATEFVVWPGVTASVKVPSWATFANMRIDISGIAQLAPLADAEIRAHIGNSQVSGSAYIDNDAWSDGVRHSLILTCGGVLLDAERGADITLKAMARSHANATHTGLYRADGVTHVGYDIQFEERTV